VGTNIGATDRGLGLRGGVGHGCQCYLWKKVEDDANSREGGGKVSATTKKVEKVIGITMQSLLLRSPPPTHY
jgi:hypothetical protein